MRVILTGSRWWSEPRIIYKVLKGLLAEHGSDLVIVHGDCPTGADRTVRNWCETFLVKQERHPADWKTHGHSAGPIRNQEMVDAGADLCVAFPYNESRGTFDCIRRAEAASIPVTNWGAGMNRAP